MTLVIVTSSQADPVYFFSPNESENHFLAFLPDNVSQHSEKSLVNGFMNKKMGTDDTTTGYEAEMFASVLQPLWWLLGTSVHKLDGFALD